MKSGVKFWGNGFKKIYSNVSDQFLFYVFFLLLFFVNILNNNHVKGQPLSCDKSRKVFYDRSGIIADGPIGSNYTQDSHCEWLIRANNSAQFITLTFRNMHTECSYDYLFVYDGDSYNAPLMGSFSGNTQPQNLTAKSGSMLILLYSDTNYVLDGVRAEFLITDCPNNCTGRGMCAEHTCVCHENWLGADCSQRACPDKCGADFGRGICYPSGCQCNEGYSGIACSLDRKKDGLGNSWHKLSHSEAGLRPRAAHTAVYDSDSDALYVFGGYDLNNVLGDLSIFRFSTNRWEDENGATLAHSNIESEGSLSPPVLAAILRQVDPSNAGIGLNRHNSLLHHIIYSLRNNPTLTSNSATPLKTISRIKRQTSNVTSTLNQRVTEFLNKEDYLRLKRDLEDLENDDSLVDITDQRTFSGQSEHEYVDEKESDKTTHPTSPARPKPRYGHAAAPYFGGFVIYGGKLSNGKLSDELWFYNVSSNRWSLRATSSPIRPPPLTRHTLTQAHSGWVYLFGGALEGGEFSSRLYRIRFDSGYAENWELVVPRGSKQLDVRVVAHSTVYDPRSRSLIVYGGVVPGIPRFSRLSDNMFAFQIDNRHWTELLYPRTGLRDLHVPRGRAFHTANIIGNYLIIFGGYSHRHNTEEICYDRQLYLYHLRCHAWVSHEALREGNGFNNLLNSKPKPYPKKQGVFAHAATVRDQHTLLIVGGYHGNVNGDLLAYRMPGALAGRDPESLCHRHGSRGPCVSNPECGWCTSDEACYGRLVAGNCTTNLLTTLCPGICSALGDCHACLAHGSLPAENAIQPGLNTISVADKLHLGQCSWCVQNARCHPKDDNYGVCGIWEDTPSQAAGYWGTKGTEVTQASQCRLLDRRPGLTFLKYKHPANLSHPDFVSIINATTADINILDFLTRQEHQAALSPSNGESGQLMARLIGSLRPPELWKDQDEILRVCASYAATKLLLSKPLFNEDDQNGRNNPIDMKLVAELSAEHSRCMIASWPDRGEHDVSLESGRFLVDFIAKKNITHNSHEQSKMELYHSKSQENPKVFTFEYLEPYTNGSCSSYTNCLHCLSDSLCGWCEANLRCYSRDLDETVECRPDDAISLSFTEDWQYLTLVPAHCPNCSNYISCETCALSGLCEWRSNDLLCVRRGRTPGDIAVREPSRCPTPCHARTNCSQCLAESGRCVWCESLAECFSFHVYTTEYQFGLCREWLDHPRSNSTAVITEPPGECKVCEVHNICSSCLRTLGCGWCYNLDDPINGTCVPGDFNHPNGESCQDILSRSLGGESLWTPSSAQWAYAQCPDVNECAIGLHDCHKHAHCINTNGSYNCTCRRGYEGDGKHTCAQTCYKPCINGFCTGEPHYKCKCNLGWTGDDCSINCGCHNHSTCYQGVGICDECQEWTLGQYCEECRPGSYGNATTGHCHVCNCNEHGSETKGICDRQTGFCFCQDNTEGKNCDKCQPGYYGDPRSGGMCYAECKARYVLSGGESQGLGSRISNPMLNIPTSAVRECLWLVMPSPDSSSIIEFTIHDDINIDCQQNAIYVYDGIPDFVSSKESHHSSLLGVFCSKLQPYPTTVESKSGGLTVYYKQTGLTNGFNASYNIYTCSEKYPTISTNTSSCKSSKIRKCNNEKCGCLDGQAGPDCFLSQCPANCSSQSNHGFCDKIYGRCNCEPGWGGEDCAIRLEKHQLVYTTLLDTFRLSDSVDHLRKMLPRFGHTLVADRRHSLWMFGGYSLSNGPLNDIRQFETNNNTWVSVTVDSSSTSSSGSSPPEHSVSSFDTPSLERDVNTSIVNKQDTDDTLPRGRYFHASEIEQSRRLVYIHGGLGADAETLSDFWRFNLHDHRWTLIQKKTEPGSVAGHTLTFYRDDSHESLILIGGFSPKNGFLEQIWEFNLKREDWQILNTTGDGPGGLYGHSTVYHPPSKSLYIFGGISYLSPVYSSQLFVLHIPTQRWSTLPALHNTALPGGRFLHAAVTNDDFMLVYGGLADLRNATDTLMAYDYACGHWVLLQTKDVDAVGTAPPPTHAHSMAYDSDSGFVYISSGFDGRPRSWLNRISIPRDLCTLWKGKERCRSALGCSYCAVYIKNDDQLDSKPVFEECYNNADLNAIGCVGMEGTVKTNGGTQCNSTLLRQRSCDVTTCAECLARWPVHPESTAACKWTRPGRCIPIDDEDDPVDCPDLNGCSFATDCQHCKAIPSCVWLNRGGRCVSQLSVSSKDVLETCPSRCMEHNDCRSCLTSKDSDCRWSSTLHQCISPHFQPLVCTGGVCGLVLTRTSADQCPVQCSSFKQCSTCLQNTRCGWCALKGGNLTGEGVCTEGSMDAPSGTSELKGDMDVCPVLYKEQVLKSVDANATDEKLDFFGVAFFTWEYIKCPPENECRNKHHNCHPQSEQCVDEMIGFMCQCANGYRPSKEGSGCEAHCSQGCVRGQCINPNECRCDFGYVGANCSIQCLCHGHSECEGPDKLDHCIACQNHTMGKQCDKCKPGFVGDPISGQPCIPCIEFCHGHTEKCKTDHPTTNKSEYSLSGFPKSWAKCIDCGNLTKGDQCETCIDGHFRGSEDLREPCRSCQCNGHGDRCDPVTGEKCNCGNNTESENNCVSANSANAAVEAAAVARGSIPVSSVQQCWQVQCSKCRESYNGQPTNGHQCYKQISVDNKYCFDAKQLGDGKNKLHPLQPGQTVFFSLQPRYTNVDMRVIVDVTKGSLDLYLAPSEDVMVVKINASNGEHSIDYDRPLYHLLPNPMNEDTLNFDISSSRGNSFTISLNDSYGPITPSKPLISIQRESRGLTTFVTVPHVETYLIVKNVRNRLVLTLPQDRLNLIHTRFHIALKGTMSGPPAYGQIFFRQDQLHIDLFVFFSVFFSCFFLFLAACVVAWKAKQAADVRRARRRHVVEMLHMAKRPFASVTLLLESHYNEDTDFPLMTNSACIPQAPIIPSSTSPLRRKQITRIKNPVMTGEVRPVAVEPTEDGIAAVGTVFVQLPGGRDAPVRLALASSLILLARVYPLNGRAFLRRRSSHQGVQAAQAS